jgi:DNA-binding NtrC family response regulator
MSIKSGSRTILLVDEEPDIVYFFKYVLENGNYDVRGFTNSIDALEHYKTYWERYGLVISDIRMHDMTGFELLKNIKKIDVNIPIILMSVYDIIDFYELEGVKINGFMQKPITIKEILSTTEKHFDNSPISARYCRDN